MFKRLAEWLQKKSAPPPPEVPSARTAARPPRKTPLDENTPPPADGPVTAARSAKAREEAASQETLALQILSEAVTKNASEVRIDGGRVRYRIRQLLVDGPAVSGSQRLSLSGLLRLHGASKGDSMKLTAVAGERRAEFLMSEPLLLTRVSKSADLASLKKRASQIADLQLHAPGAAGVPLPLALAEILIAALVDDLRSASAAEAERMEAVLRDLGNAAPTADPVPILRKAEAALRGFARRP